MAIFFIPIKKTYKFLYLFYGNTQVVYIFTNIKFMNRYADHLNIEELLFMINFFKINIYYIVMIIKL